MRRARDATELGIDDVVLGDDVGDQRAHAEKPAAEPDQHQRQRRQDRMPEHAEHEGRGSSPAPGSCSLPPVIGSTGHR